MLVSDVTIVIVVTMVTTPVFQRRKMLRNTWQYLRKEQDQTLSGQPVLWAKMMVNNPIPESYSKVKLIRTAFASQSTKWKDTQFSRSINY